MPRKSRDDDYEEEEDEEEEEEKPKKNTQMKELIDIVSNQQGAIQDLHNRVLAIEGDLYRRSA